MEEFGKIFGMSKIWTHSLEKGRHETNLTALRLLKIKFGTSYDYLIDGVGSDTVSEEIKRLRVENEKMEQEIATLKKEKAMMTDYIDMIKAK